MVFKGVIMPEFVSVAELSQLTTDIRKKCDELASKGNANVRCQLATIVQLSWVLDGLMDNIMEDNAANGLYDNNPHSV